MTSFNFNFFRRRKVKSINRGYVNSSELTRDIRREISALQSLREEYFKIFKNFNLVYKEYRNYRECSSEVSLTVMELLNGEGIKQYKDSLENKSKRIRSEVVELFQKLDSFLYVNSQTISFLKDYYIANPPYVKNNTYYVNVGMIVLLFTSAGYSIMAHNSLDILRVLANTSAIGLPFYFAIEALEFKQRETLYSFSSALKHKFNYITGFFRERKLRKIITEFNKITDSSEYDNSNHDIRLSSLTCLLSAIEWRLENLENQLKAIRNRGLQQQDF
ncbi:MAG: hypothetical protein N3E37_05235 [Candidatus Micrarchaeota archaeon]|nr:hypothetical protein [Candidatus Micrarchaeota archaeon]